ncbi:dead deah box helicase domain-containing protein, partial [Cystoisospora suis]
MSALTSPRCSLGITYCVLFLHPLFLLSQPLQPVQICFAGASAPPSPSGATRAELGLSTHCSLRPGPGTAVVDPRHVPAGSAFSRSDLRTVSPPNTGTHRLVLPSGRCLTPFRERNGTAVHNYSHPAQTEEGSGFPVSGCSLAAWFSRVPEHFFCHWECSRRVSCRPSSTALYPSGCATAAVHALAFLPSRSRRSGYCPGIPRARWTVDYPTTPTFSVHICTSSHSVSHRCRTPRSGSTPDNLLSQRSFHLLRRSGHFRLLRKAGPCKVAGLTSPIGLGPGSSCGRSCLEALHVSRLFLLCLSFLFPVFSRSSVCFFSTISRDAASHEGWSARVRCTSTWEPPILEHQFQTREAVSGSRRTQSKSLVAVYSNVLGERLTSSESADPPHVRKPRGARRDRHFCLPTHSSSCTSLPELAGAGRRIAHARVAACSIERPQSTVQSSPSTAVSVSLQDRKASPKETASFTQKDAGGETLCESEPSLRSSTVGLEIPLKVNSRPTFTPEHIKGVESAEKCYSVPLSYFLTRPLRSLRGISEIRSRILASQANVSSCFDLLLFLPLKYVEIQRGGANEPWSSRNPKCPSAECKEARDGTRSLDAVTRSDGSFEKHSSSREREDGRNTSLQASSEICGTRESQGIGPACLRLKTVDGDFSSPQLAGDRFRETGTGPGDSVKHAEERAASAQPVGETYVRERQQQPCITNSRGPLDLSGSSEIKCTRQTWEEQQERLREQLRVSLVGYLKEQDGDEECPMGRGQVARDKVSEDSSAGQESFCSRNTEKRRTSWTGNETAIIGCIEKISHCRLRSRRSFRGRPMMISTAMVRNMWFSAEESHNTSRRGDLKEPLPVDPKMSASFEKGSLTLPVAEQGASEGGANAGGTAKEPSTESSYAPRTITATWVNQFLKLVKLKKRHIICLIGKLDRVKSGRLKMQNPKVHLVAASEDAFFKSGTVLPDPENLVTGVTATAGAGACDGQGGEPLFRLCSEAAEGASIADGRESQGLHASELEKPGETPELLSQQASQKHESARQEGLGSWRLPSASSSDSRLSLTHTQEEAGGLPCVHISGPSETQKRSQVEHVSTSAGLLPEPDALSGQTGGTGKRRRDFSQQKEFKGGSTKPAQERQAVCTGAGFSLLSGAHSFVPVYPSVAGVPAKVIRAGIETLLSEGTIADLVPQRLRERRGLASLDETIRALHAPKTTDEIRLARKDLFYTSMLWLQLARKLRTREVEDEFPGYANRGGDEALKTFIASLPFKLTLSQLLAVKEIQQDMESTRPMRRLLQGDVGSGKTVVAAAALLLAAAAGQQAALLAPTAALARQHQYNLQRFLGPSGFQVHLLVSDAPDKDRTIDLINSGKAAITVGTHALLQSYVEFPRLGLVVVDEQQKFGVNQRWKLLLQKANATSRRHLGDNVDAPFREKEKEAERANPELSPDDSGSSLGDGETEERISTMQRDSTGSGDFSHLTGEVAVSVTKRESVLSLSPG